MEILLRQEEVNPDRLDNRGGTPLSWADENGHERVVTLLESHKVVSPLYGLGPKKRRLV